DLPESVACFGFDVRCDASSSVEQAATNDGAENDTQRRSDPAFVDGVAVEKDHRDDDKADAEAAEPPLGAARREPVGYRRVDILPRGGRAWTPAAWRGRRAGAGTGRQRVDRLLKRGESALDPRETIVHLSPKVGLPRRRRFYP